MGDFLRFFFLFFEGGRGGQVSGSSHPKYSRRDRRWLTVCGQDLVELACTWDRAAAASRRGSDIPPSSLYAQLKYKALLPTNAALSP